MPTTTTEHCLVKYWNENLGAWVYPKNWEPRINQYLYHSTTTCDQPFSWGGVIFIAIVIGVAWLLIKSAITAAAAPKPAALNSPEDYDSAAKLLRARTDYLHEQIDNELKSADLQHARRIIEGHAKVVEPKK